MIPERTISAMRLPLLDARYEGTLRRVGRVALLGVRCPRYGKWTKEDRRLRSCAYAKAGPSLKGWEQVYTGGIMREPMRLPRRLVENMRTKESLEEHIPAMTTIIAHRRSRWAPDAPTGKRTLKSGVGAEGEPNF